MLKKKVDNIAMFSNDNIINSAVSVTISDAFSVSDEIFYIPIEIILSILTSSGIINIDFADILTTLKGSKLATIAYEKENGLEVYVTYEVLESIGTNEKIVF